MAVATSTAMLAATVAATAVSTAQQVSAANAAAKTASSNAQVAAEDSAYQGYLNKEMAKVEAENVAKQTELEMLKIRTAAQTFRGTQLAQIAASGVVVGDGSAQAVVDQTNKLAEQDALATAFSGVNKQIALQTGGRWAEQKGINVANSQLADGAAKAAAYKNQATGALLSGVTSIAGTALKNPGVQSAIGLSGTGRAA